jgi:hypothetical protein
MVNRESQEQNVGLDGTGHSSCRFLASVGKKSCVSCFTQIVLIVSSHESADHVLKFTMNELVQISRKITPAFDTASLNNPESIHIEQGVSVLFRIEFQFPNHSYYLIS